MAKHPTKKQRDEAIRLKYQGVKYEDISKKIKVAIGTIQNWFMRDGLLFDEYTIYARTEEAEARSKMRADIREGAGTAVKMMTGLMASKNDHVKHKAAKDLMDRFLGKATQPLEFKPETDDPDEMSWDEIVAERESRSHEKPNAKKPA